MSGGLRGSVTSPDGQPVAGATVALLHQPTNATDETTTNAKGAYVFSGKPVGGPYFVTVTAPGFEPYKGPELFLSLGKFQDLDVALKTTVEEIVVTGTQMARGVSPRAVFDAEQIAETPSISRDPKDLVRLMPEAYVDSLNTFSLSIGGVNNRFNSITIDGIRQDDDFGLNAQGYPTQRSPISLSAIQEIAVEQSPFDVRYARFLGGNVNIVTKSGSNDYHGSVFFTFTNDSFAGEKSVHDDIELDYRELQYGLSLSGPVIEDKLHVFLSLEGFGGETPFDFGPAGSGATNEVAAVSQADVDRAIDIADRVYGFDAGDTSKPLGQDDYKVFAKLDWAATDDHRVTGTFQRTAGNRIREYSPYYDNLYLTSYWYDKTEILYTSALRLNSSWSSELNTELEVSGKIVDTRQESLNGADFMAADIDTVDGGTIYLGPDPNRHANKLDNWLLHTKASADYLWGDHLLTGGIEYERLSIFNLYVYGAEGIASYDSLDAFEAKTPSSLFYQNSVTNDADDAAANWWYGVVSAYLQDELEITPEINAQFGLRYDVYHAAENISLNENFVGRYGFENTETIHGRGVIMPRAGVTYSPLAGMNLRGGFGLYSGGTPTVWVSNNYTNDGVSIDSTTVRDAAIIDGFNGYDVPADVQAQLVAGDGQVNALDPDFKIPSTWKASLGMDYQLELPVIGGLDLNLNYTYSKVRHAVMWKDLRRDLESIPYNTPVGELPDGRPYYDTGNADPDLNFDPNRGADLLLTNTDKGHGHVISGGLRKRFDFGLQLYAGYAFQDVNDVNPGAESVAATNYGAVSVSDPNDPDLATSNFERRHRLIGVIEFARPLIADLLTSASLVIESRSGQPYSYTFGGNRNTLARVFGEDQSIARRNHQLFYVPSGDGSDVVLDGIDPAELDAFLEDSGLAKYRGQIAPRNAFRSPWYHRFDVRLAQQVTPTPWGKARIVLDLQNVGNLINPNWGRYEQVGWPYNAPIVDVRVDPATGQYVYSNLNTEKPTNTDNLASVWRVQVGVVYDI